MASSEFIYLLLTTIKYNTILINLLAFKKFVLN